MKHIDWLARNHWIEPETIRKLFAFYDAHKPARTLHPAEAGGFSNQAWAGMAVAPEVAGATRPSRNCLPWRP
jgi:hypothetical protein